MKVRNHAYEIYKLYPLRCDLHRDIFQPMATQNPYANHTSWGITCIAHGDGFSNSNRLRPKPRNYYLAYKCEYHYSSNVLISP